MCSIKFCASLRSAYPREQESSVRATRNFSCARARMWALRHAHITRREKRKCAWIGSIIFYRSSIYLLRRTGSGFAACLSVDKDHVSMVSTLSIIFNGVRISARQSFANYRIEFWKSKNPSERDFVSCNMSLCFQSLSMWWYGEFCEIFI